MYLPRRWRFVMIAGVASAYWCEKTHNIRDLKALMDKAEINECEIVEKIAEEMCCFGMLVGKIKDRFGHIWELSSSAGKKSDKKFDKSSLVNFIFYFLRYFVSVSVLLLLNPLSLLILTL
ncbi:hypothetical protein PRUPE_1G284200 [Prunus persica]|uniref:Uncharacterized protein n=1 Tax=Prunus persica TaxID=3760 RepID=A0A251R4J1_PRUPE|nr:hypothetical protein PRUPE_1G284200 [Prunus persica]